MKTPPPFFRKILELLDAGNYPSKIARILNLSPRRVHYWIKKAEKQGLIKLDKKDVITLYRLTPYGKEILYKKLTWGDRLPRLHSFSMKYPIIEEPKVSVDWKKVEMANWTRYVGTELGVRVEKTTRHIIVHAEEIRGEDPYEIYYLARRECDRVARYLEEKFQMKLGIGERLRKPHFGIYDPIAEKVGEHIEFSDDVGKLDMSEGYGELDLYDPRFVKNYLITFTSLPSMVKRQERELSEIKEILQVFAEGMREHMKLIRQLQETTKALRDIIEEIREMRK